MPEALFGRRGIAGKPYREMERQHRSALGSGYLGLWIPVTPEVYSLVVNGNTLYAGGFFTNAGGVSAKHIAKWDGGVWSALSAGVNDTVVALAVSGTDLYAGGFFTSAGGVPANKVAKWNGGDWIALGSGIGGYFVRPGHTLCPCLGL